MNDLIDLEAYGLSVEFEDKPVNRMTATLMARVAPLCIDPAYPMYNEHTTPENMTAAQKADFITMLRERLDKAKEVEGRYMLPNGTWLVANDFDGWTVFSVTE